VVRGKVVAATYCCGHQWTDEVKPRWLVYHLCLFRDLCRGLLYLYPALGQGLCHDRNIDACRPRYSDGGVFCRRLCKIDDAGRLCAGLCRRLVDGLCLCCFLLLLLGTDGGRHHDRLVGGGGGRRSRRRSGILGAFGRRHASALPSCSASPATESGIGGSTSLPQPRQPGFQQAERSSGRQFICVNRRRSQINMQFALQEVFTADGIAF